MSHGKTTFAILEPLLYFLANLASWAKSPPHDERWLLVVFGHFQTGIPFHRTTYARKVPPCPVSFLEESKAWASEKSTTGGGRWGPRLLRPRPHLVTRKKRITMYPLFFAITLLQPWLCNSDHYPLFKHLPHVRHEDSPWNTLFSIHTPAVCRCRNWGLEGLSNLFNIMLTPRITAPAPPSVISHCCRV